MTVRWVGVLATTVPAAVPAALADAMLEDVVDAVSAMPRVTPAVLAVPARAGVAAAVVWPGTPVLTTDLGGRGEPARRALAALADHAGGVAAGAAVEVAVVAADVPDLPPLLLGKLFSALAGADVAACPAADGGLVALAARVPLAGWLPDDVRLDDPGALARLRAAAPPRALTVGPGWRRVRAPVDVQRLDPGLEGWDATRAYLATQPG